jgi:hypothetical protein
MTNPNIDAPTDPTGTDSISKIIDVFLCTSDSGGHAKNANAQTPLNFRLNFGDYPVHSGGLSEPMSTTEPTTPRCTVNRAPFAMHRWNGFNGIIDGLSNTLFISERGVATTNPRDVRQGIVMGDDDIAGEHNDGNITDGNFGTCLGRKGNGHELAVEGGENYGAGNEIGTGNDADAGAGTDAVVMSNSGRRWMDGSVLYCGFVPILPPNAPSCGSKVRNSTITPSSYHPGGVNTGMADGGGKFFSETVNYTTNYAGSGGAEGAWAEEAPISGMTVHGVWGALGNRDGGESVAF